MFVFVELPLRFRDGIVHLRSIPVRQIRSSSTIFTDILKFVREIISISVGDDSELVDGVVGRMGERGILNVGIGRLVWKIL